MRACFAAICAVRLSARARLVAQVVLHALDVRAVVLDARAQHRHSGVLLAALRVQLGALGAQALLLHVVRVRLFRKLLRGGVQLVQRGVRALQLLLGQRVVGVELDGIGLDLVQVFEPDGDLQRAQLVAEDQVFLRLLRLRAQRPDLQLQLGDLVVDAQRGSPPCARACAPSPPCGGGTWRCPPPPRRSRGGRRS